MSLRPIVVLTANASLPGLPPRLLASLQPHARFRHAEAQALLNLGGFACSDEHLVAVPDNPCTDTLRGCLEQALPRVGTDRRILIDLLTGQTFLDHSLRDNDWLVESGSILAGFTDVANDPYAPDTTLQVHFLSRTAPDVLPRLLQSHDNGDLDTARAALRQREGLALRLVDLGRLIVAAARHAHDARLVRDGQGSPTIYDILGTLHIEAAPRLAA